MNKQRRKELYEIERKLLLVIRFDEKTADVDDIQERLENVKGDLESVLMDEEDYKDNIPENLQGSIRYDASEDACSNIEMAIDSLEYALSIENLNDIIDSVEEAIDYINDAAM